MGIFSIAYGEIDLKIAMISNFLPFISMIINFKTYNMMQIMIKSAELLSTYA